MRESSCREEPNLGNISYARCTFNQIPRKNAYTWNSMMSSYVRNELYSEAVNCLYDTLLTSKVGYSKWEEDTFLGIQNGFPVGCLCSCFSGAYVLQVWIFFRVAHEIFNDMPVRDMGCWNAIVSGFCQNGNAEEALKVLDEMRSEGVKMDPVTVSTILPFYAQLNDIVRGMLTQLYVIKHGLDCDVFVGNALINMYAKFGKLGHAQDSRGV